MSEAQNDQDKFVSAIAIAGASVPIVEGIVALSNGGVIGGIVGLGVSGLVWLAADEMAKSGRGLTLPASSPHRHRAARPGQPGVFSRLLIGKDDRGVQPQPKDGRDDPQTDKLPDVSFDLEGEDDMPRMRGDYFLFSEVLANFEPTIDQIFLARTDDNVDLFCRARDLCHVALAGVTGGGKSSIMRMLMLQLCKARLQVLLLNPHYTRCDIEAYGPDGKLCPEDWTPFEPYLVYDPMKCRDYGVIEHYLRSAAKDIIPRRLEKRALGRSTGKPYFIVIDELPSIVRNVKEAPEYMRVILEEGRKVGVFLISAAQDFLVKSISPNGGGGSIRECYRTAYYVGGDPTTAKVLLDMPANQIPEDELGKGAVMLRGSASKKASLVFVPYVDNESLYHLLGSSTYERNSVSSGVDFPLSLSPEPQMIAKNQAQDFVSPGESETGETLVKQAVRLGESQAKDGETLTNESETLTISHGDETAILIAVIDLQIANVNITREAIKQKLGWNNKKHDIVKAVCDKHGIAVR